MGAGQSQPDREEDKIFYSNTPISFSEDVVNHLTDQVASPNPSPERQSTLDAHVRARIQSELQKLQQEEEVVKSEIERALEKENLDKERELSEDSEDGGVGSVKSSAVLMGDLEEVRQKVEKYQRRTSEETSEWMAKRQAVQSCYSSNSKQTLDCWKEVTEFKASVGQLEQHYVHSLR
ncbi:hypothetical protein QCA50_002615 [Cerrena zonata]|uniref:Uncharacterized protein n=1 Tax=Cerrena zonata TaxID=2478898 RepID=A0AAW0GPT0_9APHY